MKRNLIVLTGIVFVLAVLVAVGCNTRPNPESQTPEEKVEPKLLPDSKDVDIYLKEKLIEGRMHLEMYDTRDTTKIIVDNLETLVHPGSTVKWKKATGSEIDEVNDIHLIDADSTFTISRDTIGLMRSQTLTIPISADTGTIKYEIVFTVKHGGGTWCIDPYLRIED